MSTPAATKEWRWIPVYQRTDPTSPAKTLFTGAVSYALLPHPQTPGPTTTWTASDTRGGYTGAVIQNLGPGIWHAYAQPTTPPDAPVIDCGTFTLE